MKFRISDAAAKKQFAAAGGLLQTETINLMDLNYIMQKRVMTVSPLCFFCMDPPVAGMLLVFTCRTKIY